MFLSIMRKRYEVTGSTLQKFKNLLGEKRNSQIIVRLLIDHQSYKEDF